MGGSAGFAVGENDLLPPLTLFSVGVTDGELVAVPLVGGASSLLLEHAVRVPMAAIAALPAKSAKARVSRGEFMIVSHLAGSRPVHRRDRLLRHIVPLGQQTRAESSAAASSDFGG